MKVLLPQEQVFIAVANSDHNQSSRVTADELIWERLQKDVRFEPGLRAIAAGSLIESYLASGLSDKAITLYESLDENFRKRVTTGPEVGAAALVPHTRNFLHFGMDPESIARGLAVSYADRHQLDHANDLLNFDTTLPQTPNRAFDDDYAARRSANALKCIRTLLSVAPETDWFGWRFGLGDRSLWGSGCTGALRARAYQRRTAQAIALAGMPESWNPGISPNENSADANSNSKDFDEAVKKLPAVAPRILELKQLLAQIDQTDARWIEIYRRAQEAALAGGRERIQKIKASPNDRALARQIEKRLAQPLINPYRIVQLPNSKLKESTKNTGITCNHEVLRCIEVDGFRWDLILSQDFDPTGEIPTAGFWLRRTQLTGGEVKNFYLGIREHSPFELVESDIPLIDGGELRLKVRESKLDPNTVTFPPIGLKFQSDAQVFELRAKLDDVIKDSDGDGLTDLAEQRLLLDPNNADSDNDGISDSVDAMPNVPFNRTPTLRQQVFASALAYMTREPDRAISVAVPGSDSFVRRQTSDERTLFVIADPDDAAGVSSNERIIVLPTSLDFHELWKQPGYATFFPTRLSLKMLDETHAEVVYGASWAGGTLAMEWKDGKWMIGVLSGWIT